MSWLYRQKNGMRVALRRLNPEEELVEKIADLLADVLQKPISITLTNKKSNYTVSIDFREK